MRPLGPGTWSVAALLKRIDVLETALEPFAALETTIRHRDNHWVVDVRIAAKDIRRAVDALRGG